MKTPDIEVMMGSNDEPYAVKRFDRDLFDCMWRLVHGNMFLQPLGAPEPPCPLLYLRTRNDEPWQEDVERALAEVNGDVDRMKEARRIADSLAWFVVHCEDGTSHSLTAAEQTWLGDGEQLSCESVRDVEFGRATRRAQPSCPHCGEDEQVIVCAGCALELRAGRPAPHAIAPRGLARVIAQLRLGLTGKDDARIGAPALYCAAGCRHVTLNSNTNL